MAVVAVPTVFHEDVALALAAAGVHTLVEKPIAATSEAGRKVAQAFAEAGLVGAVGHIERFNPALQELRRRTEAGELGEVYQIATRRQGPFPRASPTSGSSRTSVPTTSTSRPGSPRARSGRSRPRRPTAAVARTRTW